MDKKIHNQITQYGSKVGVTLKFLKEKEPIVNEKIDQDSTRIDKLEDIITNLGSAFSSMKNTPNLPTIKVAKFMYVLKVSKLCLFYLPMQVDSCSHKLFAHKIPMHRKYVRLKCASNILYDALFMFQFLSFM